MVAWRENQIPTITCSRNETTAEETVAIHGLERNTGMTPVYTPSSSTRPTSLKPYHAKFSEGLVRTSAAWAAPRMRREQERRKTPCNSNKSEGRWRRPQKRCPAVNQKMDVANASLSGILESGKRFSWRENQKNMKGNSLKRLGFESRQILERLLYLSTRQ